MAPGSAVNDVLIFHYCRVYFVLLAYWFVTGLSFLLVGVFSFWGWGGSGRVGGGGGGRGVFFHSSLIHMSNIRT